MKARELTTEALFAGKVEYVAPSFQRPYAWREPACRRVLDAMASLDPALHFQGAVVSMELGETEDGARKRLLIDGNHRLMTVLVAMLAVRDHLARLVPGAGDDINRLCFLNAGRASFKNIVPRKDRAAFEALVLGETPPAGALTSAHRFITDALTRDKADALKLYRDRLLRSFTFVSLELERHENPYPVFKLLSVPGEDFTLRGLAEYTRFSHDPELMAMIAGGESQDVEFKERTINREKQDFINPANIIRSVAGFMNTSVGGTLLIGIRDDGSIRGIDDEYAAVDKSKSNWDGYQLFLNNVLRTRLSVENPFLYYSVEKHRIQGCDICMLRIRPANAPVYVDKHLYVRSANQTIEMLGPDLVHYVATRWPEP